MDNKTKKVWEEYFAVHDVEVVFDMCGGYCPVQAEGDVFGKPFYFRARHGAWTLDIVAEGQDPVLAYPREPHLFHSEGVDPTRGWMDVESEVLPLLLKEFETFKSKMSAHNKYKLSPKFT